MQLTVARMVILMDPFAFRFGLLGIRWYSLLILAGTLAGMGVVSLELKRHGDDPAHPWRAISFCLPSGLLGARLYHVFTVMPSSPLDTHYYLTHPWKILAFWEGGMGIYGGVLGGALGLYLYTRLVKRRFLYATDLLALGLPIGQAIGRWGNFFNQELYGAPTEPPWGIYIAPENRLPGYESFEYFHPAFLYESLWNLLTFGLLFYLARRHGERLLEGELSCLYLILYPLGRFFLEMIRLGSHTTFGISTAQLVAVVLIFGMGGVTLYRRWRKSKADADFGHGFHEPSPAGER